MASILIYAAAASTVQQMVVVSNEQVLANGRPSVNPAGHVRWEGIEDQFFPQAEIIAASIYPAHPQIGGVTLFTLDFCVPGEIISGNILVGSDNTNQIWLNGQYVGGSSDEINYMPGTEDNHDISDQLRSGDNTLTVLVRNLAQFRSDIYTNPDMLIFELLANFDPTRGCADCGEGPDTSIPEPGTFVMAAGALLAIAFVKRR